MRLRPALGLRSQANHCMNWLISTFDMGSPSAISESAYLDEKVRNVGCRRLACDMTRTFRARLFEFFRSRGQAWWWKGQSPHKVSLGRMSSRSPFAATGEELAMTSVSVPRTLSTTPKRIVAAILAVRNFIMSRLPRTLQRYC